jgi:tetratricopeptide (TPR) repeat protein
MRTVSIATLSAVLLAPAMLLGGCNGPTQEGMKARSAASNRMAAFSAGATYQQAEQELIAGRFERAIVSAERAIAGQPDMPEYRILKGRALLESDRLDRAEESFMNAIAAAERSVNAIEARIAEFEKVEGGPLEGVARERVELEKQSVRRVEAEAWYYLGIVRQRWNRIEQAATDYRTAFELDSQPVQYLIAASEMLLDLGRPAEVEALIEPILDRYEGDPSLLVLLARASVLEGDAVEAAGRYAEARLLRPDDQLLAEEYVRAAFEAGLYEECLAVIRSHAASYAEPRTDLLLIEARCHSMLGRPQMASAVYGELVRLLPGDVEAWIEYGTVAWELGEFPRVDLCGVRLGRLAADRWEGRLYRGVAAEARGELELAADHFRAAAERTTDVAMPQLMLARVLAASGDADGAAAAWRAAIAIDPEDADVRALAEGGLAAAGG